MNAAEVRALLFSKKLAYEDFEGTLPRFPELDGMLGTLEISASDGIQADRIATDEDGKVDSALSLAYIVINSLVLRSTKEHIFSVTDLEAVAGFGMSVLAPIARQTRALSNLDAGAVEDAKKNLPPTTNSDSVTPLQGISEEAPTQN